VAEPNPIEQWSSLLIGRQMRKPQFLSYDLSCPTSTHFGCVYAADLVRRVLSAPWTGRCLSARLGLDTGSELQANGLAVGMTGRIGKRSRKNGHWTVEAHYGCVEESTLPLSTKVKRSALRGAAEGGIIFDEVKKSLVASGGCLTSACPKQ